jgi:hypothetical protein
MAIFENRDGMHATRIGTGTGTTEKRHSQAVVSRISTQHLSCWLAPEP